MIDGDYEYEIYNENSVITEYLGEGGKIIVPDMLGGFPVNAIRDNAFSGCRNIGKLIIPHSIFWLQPGDKGGLERDRRK